MLNITLPQITRLHRPHRRRRVCLNRRRQFLNIQQPRRLPDRLRIPRTDLETVVLDRIVARRRHHATTTAEVIDCKINKRCIHHTHIDHVHTRSANALNQRTRDGGAEIVKLLKSGSAYYAPSSSAVRMVRSVLEDRNEIIPSCVYLTGQYGITDVYCGVPAKLGREGVKEVVEIDLTADEKEALKKSAEHVRENCAKLNVTV